MSLIFLMLLFPPFHVIYAPGIEIEKGYAFILNPPMSWEKLGTVDMNLLLFQVTTVIVLIGSAFLFLRMNSK
jgi:hypothetical protein